MIQQDFDAWLESKGCEKVTAQIPGTAEYGSVWIRHKVSGKKLQCRFSLVALERLHDDFDVGMEAAFYDQAKDAIEKELEVIRGLPKDSVMLDEICTCKCHTEGGMHMRNCCVTCPVCSLRIRAIGDNIAQHKARCVVG